jgi:hypothetical protein
MGSLVCIGSLETVETRGGLKSHLKTCKDVQQLEFPLQCWFCQDFTSDTVEALSGHGRTCLLWEVAGIDKEDGEADDDENEFRRQLLEVTRTVPVVDCIMEMFEGVKMTTKEGDKVFGMEE